MLRLAVQPDNCGRECGAKCALCIHSTQYLFQSAVLKAGNRAGVGGDNAVHT